MTFIRGPVCRGQIAVDVIEDQFWVAFLDPERDLSVKVPGFLEQAAPLLSLPAENESSFAPGDLWLEYARKQRKYLELRESFYDQIDPEHRGPALDWIWDGDRKNPNARLTVFRNFDNATVVKGFQGQLPKTAWIMDYPIFERIYYDLVAGFDIFGNVTHQISTRLYMDHLRMQSENLFLGLPARGPARADPRLLVPGRDPQSDLRDHGPPARARPRHADPVPDVGPEGRAARDADRAGGLGGWPAGSDQSLLAAPVRPSGSDRSRTRRRARAPAPGVRQGRLRPAAAAGRLPARARRRRSRRRSDLLYSLVHNDAHSNVAFMFGEDERRLPEDDTLTVVRGHFGSYPNFIFEVEASRISGFVDGLLALRTDADLERFAGSYGVRRTSARFWETVDWLHADLKRREPTTAGLYDFDRYKNL